MGPQLAQAQGPDPESSLANGRDSSKLGLGNQAQGLSFGVLVHLCSHHRTPESGDLIRKRGLFGSYFCLDNPDSMALACGLRPDGLTAGAKLASVEGSCAQSRGGKGASPECQTHWCPGRHHPVPGNLNQPRETGIISSPAQEQSFYFQLGFKK